jgi:heat shock protein HspQ
VIVRRRFSVGQLVRDRERGYRGAVAACDPLDPPWYFVLVHGSDETAYVAQDALEPYEGGEQIVHPRTKELFKAFAGGQYRPRRDPDYGPW